MRKSISKRRLHRILWYYWAPWLADKRYFRNLWILRVLWLLKQYFNFYVSLWGWGIVIKTSCTNSHLYWIPLFLPPLFFYKNSQFFLLFFEDLMHPLNNGGKEGYLYSPENTDVEINSIIFSSHYPLNLFWGFTGNNESFSLRVLIKFVLVKLCLCISTLVCKGYKSHLKTFRIIITKCEKKL